MTRHLFIDKITQEIQEAIKLKESGVTQVWEYSDYCENVDTYIERKQELLKSLISKENTNELE
jgi:hypothetical protein